MASTFRGSFATYLRHEGTHGQYPEEPLRTRFISGVDDGKLKQGESLANR